MNEVKKYKDVKFLGLYNGELALWYPNRLEVGTIIIPIEKGDDFVIWEQSRFLSRIRNNKRMILDGDKFVDWPQGRYGEVNRIDNCLYSQKDENGICSLSILQNSKEYLLKIECDEYGPDLVDIVDDVLMLSDNIIDCHTLLFYTKTGQRLWEYKEEDENLKINGRCIPVVDDVVVVISMRGLRPEKIQGFNIHTGERLWGIISEGKGVSNTLFVGEDKILYGCMRPFASNGLVLTSLNPFTGELIKHVISEEDGFEVMPWLVTMHGRQLYYTDNRRGNEIGVIDVDKRELIERVPLNIKKKVSIGAPVVTDDKVYVFISDLQELRVFEK